MEVDFAKNPLNKVIGLSVMLAMGFLLVVLAGINDNWSPIIVGLLFASAHLPILLSRIAFNSSDYDFNFDPQTTLHTLAIQEAGKFVSAFLLTSGVGLALLLRHCRILSKTALALTLAGGALIYGTVYHFSEAFEQKEEEIDEVI